MGRVTRKQNPGSPPTTTPAVTDASPVVAQPQHGLPGSRGDVVGGMHSVGSWSWSEIGRMSETDRHRHWRRACETTELSAVDLPGREQKRRFGCVAREVATRS